MSEVDQTISQGDQDGTTRPPEPWSIAAVRLLQGVVYHDDQPAVWEAILTHRHALTDYFAKLGLILAVAEADAMAYLRQRDDEESEAAGEAVPRLFRRTPLSFEASLICVLLRDELREFEETDLQNDRCVVAHSHLLELLLAFYPGGTDQVRLGRSLTANLRRLEEMHLVRQYESDPPAWEIRRIIKARLPLAELEHLRQRLSDYASEGQNPSEDDVDSLSPSD